VPVEPPIEPIADPPVPTVEYRFTSRRESWDRPTLDTSEDYFHLHSTWLKQPHGAEVVVVETPGQHRGASVDAAVTATPGAVLVVRTADCAPVLMEGHTADGQKVLGVAHAGWKGIAFDVIGQTVATMRSLGAVTVTGWLGPCIGPECYEFGVGQLKEFDRVLGVSIRGETSWGTPSLDLPKGVQVRLAEAGATWGGLLNGWTCTACDTSRYSFRARRDQGRHALIAWIEA
jgi:polyphenol oxidase